MVNIFSGLYNTIMVDLIKNNKVFVNKQQLKVINYKIKYNNNKYVLFYVNNLGIS